MNLTEFLNIIQKKGDGSSLLKEFLITPNKPGLTNFFDNYKQDDKLASSVDLKKYANVIGELLEDHKSYGGTIESITKSLQKNPEKMSISTFDVRNMDIVPERMHRFSINVSGVLLYDVVEKIYNLSKEMNYELDMEIPATKYQKLGYTDTIVIYSSDDNLYNTLDFLQAVSKMSNSFGSQPQFYSEVSNGIAYDSYNTEHQKWNRDVVGEAIIEAIDLMIKENIESHFEIYGNASTVNYRQNRVKMVRDIMSQGADVYSLFDGYLTKTLESKNVDPESIYLSENVREKYLGPRVKEQDINEEELNSLENLLIQGAANAIRGKQSDEVKELDSQEDEKVDLGGNIDDLLKQALGVDSDDNLNEEEAKEENVEEKMVDGSATEDEGANLVQDLLESKIDINDLNPEQIEFLKNLLNRQNGNVEDSALNDGNSADGSAVEDGEVNPETLGEDEKIIPEDGMFVGDEEFVNLADTVEVVNPDGVSVIGEEDDSITAKLDKALAKVNKKYVQPDSPTGNLRRLDELNNSRTLGNSGDASIPENIGEEKEELNPGFFNGLTAEDLLSEVLTEDGKGTEGEHSADGKDTTPEFGENMTVPDATNTTGEAIESETVAEEKAIEEEKDAEEKAVEEEKAAEGEVAEERTVGIEDILQESIRQVQSQNDGKEEKEFDKDVKGDQVEDTTIIESSVAGEFGKNAGEAKEEAFIDDNLTGIERLLAMQGKVPQLQTVSEGENNSKVENSQETKFEKLKREETSPEKTALKEFRERRQAEIQAMDEKIREVQRIEEEKRQNFISSLLGDDKGEVPEVTEVNYDAMLNALGNNIGGESKELVEQNSGNLESTQVPVAKTRDEKSVPIPQSPAELFVESLGLGNESDLASENINKGEPRDGLNPSDIFDGTSEVEKPMSEAERAFQERLELLNQRSKRNQQVGEMPEESEKSQDVDKKEEYLNEMLKEALGETPQEVALSNDKSEEYEVARETPVNNPSALFGVNSQNLYRDYKTSQMPTSAKEEYLDNLLKEALSGKEAPLELVPKSEKVVVPPKEISDDEKRMNSLLENLEKTGESSKVEEAGVFNGFEGEGVEESSALEVVENAHSLIGDLKDPQPKEMSQAEEYLERLLRNLDVQKEETEVEEVPEAKSAVIPTLEDSAEERRLNEILKSASETNEPILKIGEQEHLVVPVTRKVSEEERAMDSLLEQVTSGVAAESNFTGFENIVEDRVQVPELVGGGLNLYGVSLTEKINQVKDMEDKKTVEEKRLEALLRDSISQKGDEEAELPKEKGDQPLSSGESYLNELLNGTNDTPKESANDQQKESAFDGFGNLEVTGVPESIVQSASGLFGGNLLGPVQEVVSHEVNQEKLENHLVGLLGLVDDTKVDEIKDAEQERVEEPVESFGGFDTELSAGDGIGEETTPVSEEEQDKGNSSQFAGFEEFFSNYAKEGNGEANGLEHGGEESEILPVNGASDFFAKYGEELDSVNYNENAKEQEKAEVVEGGFAGFEETFFDEDDNEIGDNSVGSGESFFKDEPRNFEDIFNNIKYTSLNEEGLAQSDIKSLLGLGVLEEDKYAFLGVDTSIIIRDENGNGKKLYDYLEDNNVLLFLPLGEDVNTTMGVMKSEEFIRDRLVPDIMQKGNIDFYEYMKQYVIQEPTDDMKFPLQK